MKGIDFHKILIFLIFCSMTILNWFGYINITSYGIFGLTFGGLFICISTCFQGKRTYGKKMKIRITYIFQKFIYGLGWFFIVVSVYFKKNFILDSLIQSLDSNTLMLLSLAVTFLSLIIADKSQLKQKERLEEIKKRISIDKENAKRENEKIENLIKEIKRKETERK